MRNSEKQLHMSILEIFKLSKWAIFTVKWFFLGAIKYIYPLLIFKKFHVTFHI